MIAPDSVRTPVSVRMRRLLLRFASVALFALGLWLCGSAVASATTAPTEPESPGSSAHDTHTQQQEQPAESGGLLGGLTEQLGNTVERLPVVNQVVEHSSKPAEHPSETPSLPVIDLPDKAPSDSDSAAHESFPAPPKPSSIEQHTTEPAQAQAPKPANSQAEHQAKPKRTGPPKPQHSAPSTPRAKSPTVTKTEPSQATAKTYSKPVKAHEQHQRAEHRHHHAPTPDPMPSDQGAPTANQGHSGGSSGDRGGSGGFFAIPTTTEQLTIGGARIAEAAFTVTHPRTAPSRPSVSPD